MQFKNTVEILYYSLMVKWERTAPEVRHKGYLDGCPASNTQIERFAFILKKMAVGSVDDVLNGLAVHCQRNDGKSYISKDYKWMEDPVQLLGGWFFEGCTSMEQKSSIVQSLTKIGFSQAITDCVEYFVAGKSILDFSPSNAEITKMLHRMRDRNEIDEEDFKMLIAEHQGT